MENRFLNEDLDEVCEYVRQMPEADSLRDRSVLITGATGLVGSLLMRTFAHINTSLGLHMTITGMIRDREKAVKIYGEDFCRRPDISFVTADLSIDGGVQIVGKVDYIFHAAAVTASKLMVSQPVETIRASVSSTFNLLELAVEKNVKSFVYISSMEMYGSLNDDHVTEEKLGYIDPLKIRSNYPESKRLCENMCEAYLSEYDVPVKIARLAQTFGAGILPWENRVFAQFARSVINKEDIVLHTRGLSEGNYCYTSDTMKALITLLLRGENGEAYNIANEENHTTIAAMAQMAADELAGGAIKVVFDIPESNTFGYAADTHMKLSSEKLRALGWEPKHNLKDSYIRMIGSMTV